MKNRVYQICKACVMESTMPCKVYDETEIRREIEFFCRRVGVSFDEFDWLMGSSPRS